MPTYIKHFSNDELDAEIKWVQFLLDTVCCTPDVKKLLKGLNKERDARIADGNWKHLQPVKSGLQEFPAVI